ncbi:MAG: hypothetical protein AAGJ53_02730, partial [Pseudomonadota bacterium]
AGEITMPRTPLPADNTPSAEATGFSLPDLPVAINIGEVAAKRVAIGEAVFGIPVEFSIDGALSLEDGEGAGNIVATRIDGTQGAFTVEGSFANATNVLNVTALIAEEPGGIIATLAGLPGGPSIRLEAGGAGPLSGFEASFNLATDGEDRVTGSLGISEDIGFRLGLEGDVAPLFLPEYREFFGNDVSLSAQGLQGADGSLTLTDLSLEAAQMNLAGEVVIGAEGVPTFIDLDGAIAPSDSDPVTLPVAGTPLRIDSATLDIAFDAALGEDWRGDFTIVGLDRGGVGAEELKLSGTGQIVGGDEPAVSAALDFAATAVNLGDPDAQTALGEEVVGSTLISWSEGDPVEITDLVLRGNTYGLAGNVTLSPDESGLEVQADVSADVQNLANFSGLAERPLAGQLNAQLTAAARPVAGTFEATLDGNGSGLSLGIAEVDRLIAGDVDLDIALRRTEDGTFLDRIATESAAATISGTASLQTGGGAVDLGATLRDTGVIADGLPGPLRLTAEADGVDNVWDVDVLLDGEALAGSFDGQVDLASPVPAIEGSASLRSADIAPFSQRVGRDIAGGVNLAVTGSLATDLSAFDARVQGNTTDLVSGIDQADPLLAGVVRIDVSAVREATGITLREFSINGAEITANGTARYFDDGSASADFTASLPNPSLIAPGLPGPLTADLELAGGPDAWDFDGTITGPETNVTTDLTVTLTEGAERAMGTVSLRAANLEPFANLAQRPLAGALELSAEGDVAFDLTTFDLTASGTSTDLNVGVPAVNDILAGQASFAVSAETDGGQIAVESAQFRSDALTARARGRLAPDLSSFDVDVTAETGSLRTGIAQVDALLPNASLSVSAGSENEQVTVRTFRFDGQTLDVTASGTLRQDLSTFEISASAEGNNLRVGIPTVDQLTTGRSTASLEASRTDGVIRVETLSVNTAAVTGSGSGTLGDGVSDVNFEARLDNLARFVPGFPGAVSANGFVSQDTRNSDYSVSFAAVGPGGIQAEAAGTAATDLSTVNIGISGNAPLEVANRFIAPRAVSGQAVFNLRVAGPPALNSVSGTVTASNGRFSAPNLGVALDDIAARVG